MPPKIVGFVVVGVVTAAAIAFVVFLSLIKFLWGWTVPDLFPGAVEQGLIAKSVSWATAGKITVLAAFLSGITGGTKAHVDKRN